VEIKEAYERLNCEKHNKSKGETQGGELEDEAVQQGDEIKSSETGDHMKGKKRENEDKK